MSRTGRKNAETTPSTQTATLAYDNLGRIKTGIDGDWHTRQFSYDSLDRVTLATDSLGNTRSFQYDSNDNSTSQRLDTNGRLIDSRSSSFDQNDRCTRSVDAAGNVTAMHYDPAGNLIQLVTPDNYATSYEYDPLNRLIRSFDRAIQVVGPQHLDSGLGMIHPATRNRIGRLGPDHGGNAQLRTAGQRQGLNATRGPFGGCKPVRRSRG